MDRRASTLSFSPNRRRSTNAGNGRSVSRSPSRPRDYLSRDCIPKDIPISGKDFTESAPYVRKKYGIFGDGGDEEDLMMMRSLLRTPSDVKRKIMEAEQEKIDLKVKEKALKAVRGRRVVNINDPKSGERSGEGRGEGRAEGKRSRKSSESNSMQFQKALSPPREGDQSSQSTR